MEKNRMKLIIQIPCFNEAETLKTALDALPKHIEGIDEIEYLIINDGSVDNTVQVAEEWGVHHIVSFRQNKGLAKGFMAGLDASLKYGADIIVNTDADNQYDANDIGLLVRPILDGKADMVIGARPIDETESFSPLKKKLQHFGSWVVRKASATDIPDAPSGFRAFSREAALRLNVTNDYTYTLETIVQAGREKIPLAWVPVHTNKELRPSRLFHSMFGYVKKSMMTIIRAYVMYKPMSFFFRVGTIPFFIGFLLGLRYLIILGRGGSGNHIQSLILASILLLMGFITYVIGIVADIISKNRIITQDIQYRIRRMELEKEIREKE